MQTMNRWLMGEEIPPGIGLRHRITGTELSLDLLFDREEWQDRFALNPSKIMLSRGLDNPSQSELTWERIAPGHYSLRTDLREGQLIRGAAQVGKSAIPFGPLVVGASREWAFDAERIKELRETSATSGGRELLDLGDAWLKPEGKEMASIQSWLLIPLLGLILLEALVTRTGWKMPTFHRLASKSRRRRSPGKKKPAKEKVETVTEKMKVPTEKEVPGEAEEETNRRQSRFARAKKKR